MGFRSWLEDHFVSVDAIYGLILFAALIAASSVEDDPESWVVLVFSVFSLLIFWGAHVFAGTIVTHAGNMPLHRAIWTAMKHSSGMLLAAVLPSIPLLLGGFALISDEDAVDWALTVCTIILFLLGYIAFSRRKANVAVRILGGIGCALFGTLVIALNAAVH